MVISLFLQMEIYPILIVINEDYLKQENSLFV